MNRRTGIALAWMIAGLGCASQGSSGPESAVWPTTASATSSSRPVEPAAALPDIPNARQPRPSLVTGGEPSDAALAQAKAQGFSTVVSLLPETEPERTTVTDLGMEFVSIPVASPADLTEENARRLGQVLHSEREGPVLLHCASGNRAGALLALEAFHIEGMAAEDALALGLAAGLSSLRGEVESRLGLSTP